MRYCVILLSIIIGTGFAGCRERSDLPSESQQILGKSEINTTADVSNKPVPAPILDRMVNAYQAAFSYSDNATVQIIGKMSRPNTKPVSWNCNVAFRKPNQLYLEISEGIFISDGEDSCARIQSLPKQVLRFPAPKNWTLETLFQDVHLDHAMTPGLPPSVLRFSPQLILLFANDPLNTFYPKGAKAEWLEQQRIGQNLCDIIRIGHSDGNRILWISQKNGALLRLDYQPVGLPVPEGFESIESIRIEMTDAQLNGSVPDGIFQISLSADTVPVTEFNADSSGLLTPQEHRHILNLMAESDTYRQIDQQIESVIPSGHSPPKTAPETFTLSQIWTFPLVGGSSITLLPGTEPKLLIPCEGNLVAVSDLHGKSVQKMTLENVKDSIITEIRVSPASSGKQRIGILTLDSKFFLYDSFFKPLETSLNKGMIKSTDTIRDFQFIPYDGQEMLVLVAQRDFSNVSEQEFACQMVVDSEESKNSNSRAFTKMGKTYQVSTSRIANEQCVMISYSAEQRDYIMVRTLKGTELEPIEIPIGRHVLWFHTLDSKIYSTIYTLLEDPNTGDVRFAGLNRTGKGLWSRLLPTGEYETEPVFAPKEEKWFVPLPNGEIMVFDLQGNVTDTFSLNVVPTGLFCTEIGGKTVLIVTDGARVSAWKKK